MTAYIDTSVLLNEILRPPVTGSPFDLVSEAYSSELLLIESHRTLDRYRIQGFLRDDEIARAKSYLQEYIRMIHIVDLNSKIKTRARQSFSTTVGTLDALHLSTALFLKNDLNVSPKVLTTDKQLGTACMAEGFEVLA